MMSQHFVKGLLHFIKIQRLLQICPSNAFSFFFCQFGGCTDLILHDRPYPRMLCVLLQSILGSLASGKGTTCKFKYSYFALNINTNSVQYVIRCRVMVSLMLISGVCQQLGRAVMQPGKYTEHLVTGGAVLQRLGPSKESCQWRMQTLKWSGQREVMTSLSPQMRRSEPEGDDVALLDCIVRTHPPTEQSSSFISRLFCR